MKVVFFDAAGTLFEPREPVEASYARIARRFGVDASEAEVSAGFHSAFESAGGLAFGPGRKAAELRRLERQWWREVVRLSFERLGRFAEFDAFFDALFGYFADPASWIADPEAVSTILRLKDRGIRVGVISNFDHRLYRILDGIGIAAHLDSITISSEAGYAKPRREVFEAALARHGAMAREALHVGDSERLDLKAARAAGLAAAIIDRGARAPIQIEGRTGTINSLALVPGLTQRFEFT